MSAYFVITVPAGTPTVMLNKWLKASLLMPQCATIYLMSLALFMCKLYILSVLWELETAFFRSLLTILQGKLDLTDLKWSCIWLPDLTPIPPQHNERMKWEGQCVSLTVTSRMATRGCNKLTCFLASFSQNWDSSFSLLVGNRLEKTVTYSKRYKHEWFPFNSV